MTSKNSVTRFSKKHWIHIFAFGVTTVVINAVAIVMTWSGLFSSCMYIGCYIASGCTLVFIGPFFVAPMVLVLFSLRHRLTEDVVQGSVLPSTIATLIAVANCFGLGISLIVFGCVTAPRCLNYPGRFCVGWVVATIGNMFLFLGQGGLVMVGFLEMFRHGIGGRGRIGLAKSNAVSVSNAEVEPYPQPMQPMQPMQSIQPIQPMQPMQPMQPNVMNYYQPPPPYTLS